MCAVVPRKWSEGRQKGPEIDKLSSPLFPGPDDHVASSIQNITNLEEHCCAYMPQSQKNHGSVVALLPGKFLW